MDKFRPEELLGYEAYICGFDDYLQVRSKYVDVDVLVSCINPDGHGEAATGMTSNFEWGRVYKVEAIEL